MKTPHARVTMTGLRSADVEWIFGARVLNESRPERFTGSRQEIEAKVRERLDAEYRKSGAESFDVYPSAVPPPPPPPPPVHREPPPDKFWVTFTPERRKRRRA